MTVCDKCRGRAVTLVRYSGAHLCGKHFSEFVEKRVKHELRRQMDLSMGARIAVAVSGGKDSSVALALIHKIVASRKSRANQGRWRNCPPNALSCPLPLRCSMPPPIISSAVLTTMWWMM